MEVPRGCWYQPGFGTCMQVPGGAVQVPRGAVTSVWVFALVLPYFQQTYAVGIPPDWANAAVASSTAKARVSSPIHMGPASTDIMQSAMRGSSTCAQLVRWHATLEQDVLATHWADFTAVTSMGLRLAFDVTITGLLAYLCLLRPANG
eukprot:3506941-Amphidinium_carterae.3